jgi:hypothetical protein
MNTENIKYLALTSEEYVKPQIEIIEIDNEGILAASINPGGFGDGGEWS